MSQATETEVLGNSSHISTFNYIKESTSQVCSNVLHFLIFKKHWNAFLNVNCSSGEHMKRHTRKGRMCQLPDYFWIETMHCRETLMSVSNDTSPLLQHRDTNI